MYTLHAAPDTAALAVRLVLEEIGAPYLVVPVDLAARGQDKPAFRALNPQGLVPVLETADGPLFETAAILLWLSERHGALAPAPGNLQRAEFLKWLFVISNTLHPAVMQRLHPERFVGRDAQAQAALMAGAAVRVRRLLGLLDALGMAERPVWLSGTQPSVLGYYLAVLLRWCAPLEAGAELWFDLADFPFLQGLAERLERRPAALRAAAAEGLGPRIFSAPAYGAPELVSDSAGA